MTNRVALTSKRSSSLHLVEDCIKFSEMGFREIFLGVSGFGLRKGSLSCLCS